jgi:hypothetical protein
MWRMNSKHKTDLVGFADHGRQRTTTRLISVDGKSEKTKNLLVGFNEWTLKAKTGKITKEASVTSTASETVLNIS